MSPILEAVLRPILRGLAQLWLPLAIGAIALTAQLIYEHWREGQQ